MSDVLLTVSGTIDPTRPDQVAQGLRPRADYFEMARAFDADLIDYAKARELTGANGARLEKIGGKNLMLAYACFQLRKKYRVIFTDGEQVGIPLAGFFKAFGRGSTKHLMLVHVMSVGKKMMWLDYGRVQSEIDTFFVYATAQKQFIESRWKIPSERVVFTPFMVDSQFFAPQQVIPNQSQKMICAVGLERRDYPTLMRAVENLDVQVVIAAASPWSKRSDTTEGQSIPSNVTVKKFNQFELRQVYADSRFLVMPLYNVDFQAGVTAILEAMAMERTVICSRTTGQTDVIVASETGLYVPPENADALRDAIQKLLTNPIEAERMGKNGRKRIEQKMSLDCYVEHLNKFVQAAKRSA
jgi:glycosyltransferase involved in cell wall biosynthesis